MKRYYDPEYGCEITMEKIKKQHQYLCPDKSLDEFIEENFIKCDSKKQLNSFISASEEHIAMMSKDYIWY